MDKNFYEPFSGLPPRSIRAAISGLTNAALAFEGGGGDKCAVIAILEGLRSHQYYLEKLNSDGDPCDFIENVKVDLINTCWWWGEEWRIEVCWAIIESVWWGAVEP